MGGSGASELPEEVRPIAAMIDALERRYSNDETAPGGGAGWVLAVDDGLEIAIALLPETGEILLRSNLGPPAELSLQRSLETMARFNGLADQTGPMCLALDDAGNVGLSALLDTVKLEAEALDLFVADFGTRCFVLQRTLADADPDDEDGADGSIPEDEESEFITITL